MQKGKKYRVIDTRWLRANTKTLLDLNQGIGTAVSNPPSHDDNQEVCLRFENPLPNKWHTDFAWFAMKRLEEVE